MNDCLMWARRRTAYSMLGKGRISFLAVSKFRGFHAQTHGGTVAWLAKYFDRVFDAASMKYMNRSSGTY
jgi:hypothetical protein